ncbi:hypothetical protein EV215_0230 [Hypnocyclicus thermotrophus]|uniref:Uncharacterized protein n=1 Tax=Hypnocyclicus thermotrophus TaxID=1627895 RepID=A0AA46E069_9FUSO|nr:hypothetical protein [Hypnocyclicus thermotrophus]TDT72424.1 hypothetical protein EV215_0230 [Hypnocyclicus thermotrophus]
MDTIFIYPIAVLAVGTVNSFAAILSLFLFLIVFIYSYFIKKYITKSYIFIAVSILISFIYLFLDYMNFSWYIDAKYMAILYFTVILALEYINKLEIKYFIKNIFLFLFLGIIREFFSYGKIFNKTILTKFEGSLVLTYSAGGLFLLVFIFIFMNSKGDSL